jgi:hypothetical protein
VEWIGIGIASGVRRSVANSSSLSGRVVSCLPEFPPVVAGRSYRIRLLCMKCKICSTQFVFTPDERRLLLMCKWSTTIFSDRFGSLPINVRKPRLFDPNNPQGLTTHTTFKPVQATVKASDLESAVEGRARGRKHKRTVK